uniref:Uncharacterized protein n=1 Tax=Cutibacterium phage vB_CacS-HV1 TaxID=3236917 RepID=A0AB39CFJ0_9CAUD
MISEYVCAPAVLPRSCGGCCWGTLFVYAVRLLVVVMVGVSCTVAAP